MDFELMIGSFPKLLSATVITLKLLSLSLFFGLFIGLLFAILRMNKNLIINKTKTREIPNTLFDEKRNLIKKYKIINNKYISNIINQIERSNSIIRHLC